MSRELLKAVLETKEASAAGALRGSIKRALGAGAGSGATLAALQAAGLENQPLLWGLVGGAGVLGHDAAGALARRQDIAKHLKKVGCARRDKKILLQKLSKGSKGRKKKADMVKEGPYTKEYSLTKKASVSRKLTDLAYSLGIKSPNLSTQAGYGLLRGTPTLTGMIGGGIGGKLLAGEVAPHIGVKGFYAADTLPETIASLALGTGGLWGGMSLGEKLLDPVGKRLSRKLMPETARYFKIADPHKVASLTKRAGLSRAAKGAIAAPLGVMGLGALHPEMFGVLPSSIGGHLSDTIGSNVLNSLDNLAKPLLGSSHPQLANVGTSLAGLGALGAGAGKLSEKLIPVAKKSITDNPTARKAALAAALFPWSLAIGGGAYMLGKKDSDS